VEKIGFSLLIYTENKCETLRTIKISDTVDFNLETIKLLTVKKYKLRLTKGEIVNYALKTLALKMEIMMEAEQDEPK
jgi:hypothetical protein